MLQRSLACLQTLFEAMGEAQDKLVLLDGSICTVMGTFESILFAAAARGELLLKFPKTVPWLAKNSHRASIQRPTATASLRLASWSPGGGSH